jgi:hypothetical protein
MKQVTKTLIKTDAVAAALRHTEGLVVPVGKNALSELYKRRAQLGRLTDLQSTLLGVEEVARDHVQRERDKLRKRVSELEAVLLPAVTTYKVFDLEPLTWRDANSLPRLVVFALNNALFHFSTEMYDDGTIKEQYVPTDLPSAIMKCYDDVQKRITKIARSKRMTVSLDVQFTGVIPDVVRGQIADARHVFGKEIYLVAEPAKAELKHRTPTSRPKPVPPPPIRGGDPLVIGFDGRQFRLIAAFDLTPVEQLVRDRVNGIKAS